MSNVHVMSMVLECTLSVLPSAFIPRPLLDLTETSWERVDWMHLPHDTAQYCAYEYGNETSGSVKGGECLDQLGDH